MPNGRQNKTPPGWRTAFAWLATLIGLLLLNLAADSFVSKRPGAARWTLLISGLLLVGFALLRAARLK